MASWVNRVIGAAQLRSETYEEVEADKSANLQALGVVVLSAIAAGFSMAQGGGRAIGVGILAALVAWVLWAALTWLIGTKFLSTPETHADIGELLRTTGFAAAPGMLRIFGGIPVVGFVFNLVAGLWMLAAFVVAVRQALDYRSTGRALLVCGIGWLVWFAVIAWTFLLLGASVAGFQALRGNIP
ncbi:MAG TPA: hypothetical protein VFT93_04610 [Candidatus Eisenbacteria bacterium]|nr:hypothetical protein [Candidatus Eisenbacteria bacterium]